LFDLDAEPILNAAADQPAGDDEQQERGDQRQPDKGGDQFGSEAGAEQLVAPFKVEFGQISG